MKPELFYVRNFMEGTWQKAPLGRTGINHVVMTPFFDEGQEKDALIFIHPRLFEKVSDTASDRDGYENDTKTDALVAWIGRFATMELADNGIRVGGWSSWGAEVLNAEDISEHRQLLFLKATAPQELRPVTENDELYAAEQRFNERAIAFLLQKGILE